MTISFWVALVLLVALALAFIFYPLIYGRKPSPVIMDRREQNLAAYRGRLQELDEELEAGLIDVDMFERLKAEMEANLLDDVGDSPDAPQPTGAGSRKPVWVVTAVAAVFVPVLTFVLYDEWGAQDLVAQTRVMGQMASGDSASEAEMNRLVSQLRQRLESQPANPDGWLLLGRTEMQLRNYRQAADAYERLAALAGEEDQQEAAVAWGLAAQAHFFASEGRLDEAALGAIQEAQSRNPRETNTLGLLGINAFRNQNYREAIGHWEALLEEAPNHPQRGSIAGGIAQAYTELGEPVPESFLERAVTDRNGDATGEAFVQVSVQLSEQAALQVADEDVVFVYARALDGPPRPLAITRMTVADLPADIRLDDSMAMTEEDAMTPGQEVVVVARVSRSGNATPQPGDWEGETDSLRAGESEDAVLLRVNQPIE